ncbi:hypothetical protein GCM10007275_19370 [Jeotgalicoccus coquinae]|uniref:RNA polymerase sigma factor SigS n=1 Tax=Jeotgalicoccus coquinae TaxID=709509 RepID=A0A6V7RQ94_9STAP|nr:sigma-70 family RNA polymerase sigma factor [Jeotgalicoccus coquinae]MBB6423862.1 RNA polymerase sporulation-specific sigma factor [Jeotgalicoccus coquinae]GGE24396.1 hypothetical protein GCM10007275_19370 [Jeotgalicoccus coquinae]CAD2080689.1 RNA polymerase factor sigma-70 [Jeotgalicoccus coquinae]
MYRIKTFYFYIRETGSSEYDGTDVIYNSNALRVKDGDFNAFDEIDVRLRPFIRRMSFKYDMSEHDREDLIQEMMYTALILCLKYDYAKGHYRHYVLRTIRLKMYDYMNCCSARHQIEMDSDDMIMFENKHALSQIILKETQAEYTGASGDLSNYEKQVLKLLMDGCSLNDIASLCRRDPRSVINTLYRIKIKFRAVEDLHAVVDNNALSRYSILELK